MKFKFLQMSFVVVLVFCVVTLVSTKSFASSNCKTFKRFAQEKSGRWFVSRTKVNGILYRVSVKYHKNGKTSIKDKNGNVYNHGTWKRKGNIIYRYAPDKPGRKRFTFRLKKRCP